MNPRGIDFTGIAYLAVLAVAGYAVYRVAKGAPTVAAAVDRVAAAAVEAVNPASPNNLANRAANAITATVTGDPGMTPGLWLENLFKGNGGNVDGDRLLADFSGTWDRDDADLGQAGRTLMRRAEPTGWTAADQDDADLGFAMASNSGAAFMDYSKLRRGVFH